MPSEYPIYQIFLSQKQGKPGAARKLEQHLCHLNRKENGPEGLGVLKVGNRKQTFPEGPRTKSGRDNEEGPSSFPQVSLQRGWVTWILLVGAENTQQELCPFFSFFFSFHTMGQAPPAWLSG